MKFFLYTIIICFFVHYSNAESAERGQLIGRPIQQKDMAMYRFKKCHENFASLSADRNAKFSPNDLRDWCRAQYSQLSAILTEEGCDETCWQNLLAGMYAHIRLQYPKRMVPPSSLDLYDCSDRYFYACGCVPSESLIEKWQREK
jgi:hypothetical protein